MASQPLFRVGTAVVEADGTAQVVLSPPGVDWHVTVTSVVTTSTDRTRADVEVDGHFLEGTWSGNKDSSNTAYVVQDGSTLTCAWTGGTPGARATLRVWGRQTTPGQAP